MSIAVLVVVLLTITVQVLPSESASARHGASTTALPTSVGPANIAVSEDEAINLARKVVVADAVLVSASFGRFADVYQNARMKPDPSDQDRVVWAVEVESAYTICPPDASSCWTPRPGFTTVILDGYTGDWITTFSYSPK